MAVYENARVAFTIAVAPLASRTAVEEILRCGQLALVAIRMRISIVAGSIALFLVADNKAAS